MVLDQHRAVPGHGDGKKAIERQGAPRKKAGGRIRSGVNGQILIKRPLSDADAGMPALPLPGVRIEG